MTEGVARAQSATAPRRRIRFGGGRSGFGWSLGTTSFVLGTLVVVPLAMLVAVVVRAPLDHTLHVLTAPRTLAAYGLSLGTSLVAAVAAAPFGLAIAWALTRYRFPGRRIVDALVDLPFAMPTAVSGIALTSLYSKNGWMGKLLAPLGIEVSFTRLGIVTALFFVSMPFIVRTVQPVIEDFPREVEEAAASLGASPLVAFVRVWLPTLRPALVTGVSLAFARAVGEYGSVVFIAGNVPNKTEIAPLLILVKLEEYDYTGAAAIATGLLVVSVTLLFGFGRFQQRRSSRARAHG